MVVAGKELPLQLLVLCLRCRHRFPLTVIGGISISHENGHLARPLFWKLFTVRRMSSKAEATSCNPFVTTHSRVAKSRHSSTDGVAGRLLPLPSL